MPPKTHKKKIKSYKINIGQDIKILSPLNYDNFLSYLKAV